MASIELLVRHKKQKKILTHKIPTSNHFFAKTLRFEIMERFEKYRPILSWMDNEAPTACP